MECSCSTQTMTHDLRDLCKAPYGTIDDDMISRQINWLEKHETASVGKENHDPIEELKKVMQLRGLSNKDLKPYIGSEGNVCDILKRRRPLSLRMIRNLHFGLGIPAELLIVPYCCHRQG